ncbi:serine recombinase [Aureimonas sp. Leaf454]|uniref:recombinase family protein n=1 Tax=Aureimonas sp. Leaf454 TaxID=1736381 RepID=UPI0006F80C1C|nr:recombinase family protein [Aureimonas sp. Leaf454]KQT50284.1 serine recombinase [Aureimonas sp. Leaf454]
MQAIAYIRTSSAANVGEDKDSHKRQLAAISAYAKKAKLDIIASYYDAAVSGMDPIDQRDGFSQLLDHIEGNGVRTVIVEDATRFARDLLTQELGILLLIKRGVTILTSSGEDLTQTDDPMKKAMRQIAGVFAELEKHRLVSKLKGARERKKAATGKCEGRKSHAEMTPDIVTLAKRLRRKDRVKGTIRSYREISAKLAEAGHLNINCKPFAPASVQSMVQGSTRRRPA